MDNSFCVESIWRWFSIWNMKIGFFILVITVFIYLHSRKSKPFKSMRLDGKTVIITGCNTGIGKATARRLAEKGARIIMACRDLTKAEPVAEEIRNQTGATVLVEHLNLADFQSIRRFCKIILERETQINILINNAGVMCSKTVSKTVDGFEIHFGTNHLGHFLLTLLLLERIKESKPARIINVSSIVYLIGNIHWDDINMEKNYNSFLAYCQSKLANILFTRQLSKYLEGTAVNVYAVHPGIINSDITRELKITFKQIARLIDIGSRIFLKTTEQGAETSVYCATAEELKEKTGLYYSNSSETWKLRKARDDAAAKRLWDLSIEMTGLNKS